MIIHSTKVSLELAALVAYLHVQCTRMLHATTVHVWYRHLYLYTSLLLVHVCSYLAYIIFLEWLACLGQEAETLVVDTEQHDGARGGSGGEGDRVTGFSVSLIEVGGHLRERIQYKWSKQTPLSLSLPSLSVSHPLPFLSLLIPPFPPSFSIVLLLLIPGVISLLASEISELFTLFSSPHCHNSPIKSLPCVWRSTGHPLQWGQQQAHHPHEQILQELWPWAASRGWREMRQLSMLYRFSGTHKHGAEHCLERSPE